MHSATTAPAIASAPHAITRKPDARPPQVRGKLAQAIELMIEQGMQWDEAARAVDYSVRSMRKALERAHVITYIRAKKQVFREAICAKNISRLDKIADNAGNAMAQLGAIKALEQLSDEPGTSAGGVRSPGFVIVVNTGGQPVNVRTIEHKPLTDV